MSTTININDNLLKVLLEANGYTLEDFKKKYKKDASPSWKRGYAAAHGLPYGSYIENNLNLK